jgi:hypothetical protein
MDKWLVGKDLKERGGGPFESTVPAFYWRD